ncbi:MAG: alcohol dehydrogenase, partial [Actinomycetota bacterium]|nr:alcohol dehydrogenase [Actinomycetota bacterium]
MTAELGRVWRVRRPGPMGTHPLHRVQEQLPRPADAELLVRV